MSGGGDADATQYIPHVPAETPAESTTFLGTASLQQASAPAPAPAQAPAPAPGGSDDATQYIPPVPGGSPYGIRPGAPGDRQPPAEFDSLFRDDSGTGNAPAPAPGRRAAHGHHSVTGVGPGAPAPGHGAPGYGAPVPGAPGQGHGPGAPVPGGIPDSTQQMPRFVNAPQRDAEEPRSPRKRPSHVPLIAAVVVGCAVLGLGVGAVMNSGDDDEPAKDDDKQVVADGREPAAKPTDRAAADPAKPQAEALDKLLADSGNSRGAVIRSVEAIKSCGDLDKAAADLTDAARQRRDLVTRLQGLTVDKVPQHAQLSAALTKAWNASASADDHYAAWAKQAKSKKVCRHGKARGTDRAAEGNRASGEATGAKQEASRLWNAVAGKYGLSNRQPSQL
ncbi:hypothetical protein [Streptomyces sp. NPDC050504]|uniref:hypothetical protein n=1 Tax=Streptomyces sp. NPDC050504 TaxID=3365618 RepID=UPI00379D4463